MKNKVILSVALVALIFSAVSASLAPSIKKENALEENVLRWINIDDSKIIESLQNDEGQVVMSVSLTRQDMEWLLLQTQGPDITFELAIDENGDFGFLVNSIVSTSHHGFQSTLPVLESKLAGFDPTAYQARHANLDPEAKEHLMDLAPTIAEIRSWEQATEEERTKAFIASNGERLRSLSFNKAVYSALLQHEELASVTSFLALNEQKELRFINMGVDKKGDFMLPQSDNEATAKYGIYQYIRPCPPFCPPPKPPSSKSL